MKIINRNEKIKQRLFVNSLLLLYWLPALLIDWRKQYPTYDGIHYFSDYLSNWGQFLILIYLSISIRNDLGQAKCQLELGKGNFQLANKIAQLAMGQSVLNSFNFVILSLGEWKWQNIHEHAMNIVVISISFYFSDSYFRKRDIWLGKNLTVRSSSAIFLGAIRPAIAQRCSNEIIFRLVISLDVCFAQLHCKSSRSR